MATRPPSEAIPARASLIYDPKIRAIVFQVILAALVGFILFEAVSNAVENLQRQKIATGFGFFDNIAGFDISQRPIAYSATSTYFDAFLVGLLNTLIVAAIGVVLATIVGFVVGIARLSRNWLVAKFATVYVETLRNLPLLLQLLFWYGAVLKPLPGPKQSFALALPVLGDPSLPVLLGSLIIATAAFFAYRSFPAREALESLKSYLGRMLAGLVMVGGIGYALFGSGLVRSAETPSIFLNNRGLYTPQPIYGEGAGLTLIALAVAILLSLVVWRLARRRQLATGQTTPVLLISAALIIGLPLITFFATGRPIGVETPALKGFNMAGGFQLLPEFVALLIGLVTYTGAFIAEIVRSGIVAVSKGQTEAARAVGLSNGQTLRLVVVPQAMRVIIPPLTSQYLNLVKNSSLAVAIGYPDLVQVFAGTVLNQTGQAIEVISITMAVYLTISLVTATFMNWYNRRVALVER